jgi:hypothetical protein
MSRSRSRDRDRRARKDGGFSSKPSGFSALDQGFALQSATSNKQYNTAEILEYYKKYNPNQNISSHNKSDR